MKKLLLISPLLGTLFTVAFTHIVWRKNPYGEIYNHGVVYWDVLLPIIISSWILSTLAAFAALFSGYLVYRLAYHIYLGIQDERSL